ncbi:hypothetical protein LTR17_013120 [Elasticomyces elasticus]|nr:hypothetical protein LTR17_013120 [Elasticomyces elasticus]
MLEDELEPLEDSYKKWAGELERGEEQDIMMEVEIHTLVAKYPEQRKDLESHMKKQKILIEQSRAERVAAGYDPVSAEQEYSVEHLQSRMLIINRCSRGTCRVILQCRLSTNGVLDF